MVLNGISKFVTAAAMVALATGAFGQGLTDEIGGFDHWPTRPSDLRQLSFTQPGRIAEVIVEEGDTVSKDDPLLRLDDRREREEFRILSILAEDRVRVEYANAALAQARVDEQILLDAEKRQPGSVTKMELQHARLEVMLKEASRDISVLEQQEKIAQRDKMKILLDQMLIRAPMAGRVERIVLKEGESADALEKVLVLVNLDPLWVDLPVPVSKARKLNIGQKVAVWYVEDGPDGERTTGEIVHKASVVESGSNTLTVRVEFPNPRLRPAGERVGLDFSGWSAVEDDDDKMTATTDAAAKP